ncbi:conserved hypothetical protein [Dinoroseobacter shibae DFL 12 = DSM 16493]|jgi:hypothetical protein|uniref:DUF6473 domain-containing protein n=1 Tax=Dinoroseobacter shibae (strain DSM 16493 / NCIMB 14021 / DFL 12) TaxID=398580 RepID=A8LLF4_DINSH|nr:DUF6473 family protein [Dinoroseobacter shibae]ABV91964.1 conserved hypothetical protein [Dinoroseobacter shibae DFL 12 = DSM 16493]URF46936.1 DUF6473 family protein [Dinoroseobacter shibae]URF51247.1 DUF6473 family protein [Dinoroseobacter shibae]
MTYERHGVAPPESAPCFYPGLDMAFRGPERSLEGPYVTFLGGTSFYGKYAETAIPDRVEAVTGHACVNLGVMNAGLDLMRSDPMLSVAEKGAATVIELVAAQNMSNRFYRVHPRRNDRFVAPTRLLRKAFPELDLSEIHFTRHLLRLMQMTSPARFETVVEELRASWVEGMCALLRALEGPRILLWLVPKPAEGTDRMAQEPFLVDRAAVHAVSELADSVVEVRETAALRARGFAGMQVPDTHARILSALPRAALLDEAALSLLDPLHRIGIGPGRAGVQETLAG